MEDVKIFNILRDWLTTKSEEIGENLNENVSDVFLEHLIRANHIFNAEQNETEQADFKYKYVVMPVRIYS